MNEKMSMRKQFANLNISPESFQTGSIYMTKDGNVLFPMRNEVKEEDKPRMVVVMGNEEDLSDPMGTPHILAIPITTSGPETRQDLPVQAKEGNLHRNSIIKAGIIQPILKANLGKKIGDLNPETFDELKATIAINLGLV